MITVMGLMTVAGWLGMAVAAGAGWCERLWERAGHVLSRLIAASVHACMRACWEMREAFRRRMRKDEAQSSGRSCEGREHIGLPYNDVGSIVLLWKDGTAHGSDIAIFDRCNRMCKQMVPTPDNGSEAATTFTGAGVPKLTTWLLVFPSEWYTHRS